MSEASSALSWLRWSALRLLPPSLPLLRLLLICWVRVWLLLISAWARSGRVCELMIRLLASDSAFCSSPCWVLRSLSICSSCGTLRLA
ncbi:hypothetical protein D3C76_1217520 [compost metagenome]